MNIYVVRHAQKDTSPKKSIDEHFRREITDIGKQQAISLASHLLTYKINKMYCSDMPRAIQTAETIGKILKTKGQILSRVKPLTQNC